VACLVCELLRIGRSDVSRRVKKSAFLVTIDKWGKVSAELDNSVYLKSLCRTM
jgi:hypothetical protein